MEEAAKLCVMSSHLNVKRVTFKQRGLNESRKTMSSLRCRAPLTSVMALIYSLGSKNMFRCLCSFTPHENRITYFCQF